MSEIPSDKDNKNVLISKDTSMQNDETIWNELCDESMLKLLDEPFSEELNHTNLRNDANYRGFDNNAGAHWMYPVNYPVRQYQHNITKAALFRNTLVVLPTGLGKTFIAAVVMYNIYRWYPTGKVIFMAPTKPLVSQQIEACQKIVGIPSEDTSEITGRQNKRSRRELWRRKRVFFATPQVVQNDINDNEQNFPFGDIRLVVVDEAHKAKGRYAHAEAVKSMAARNPNFRVLALSATPGRTVEDVIEVIKNLFISHLEIRWENSLDVISYTFRKNIKTVVVPLGTDLNQIRNEFIDIIDPYIRYLIDNQVISGSLNSISRGSIVMEQKRFRELSIKHKHPNESQVKLNFSICVSLYHALELLERHGVRVFLNFFDDPSNAASHRYYVATNQTLRTFLEKLRKYIGPNPFLVNDQTMTNGMIPEIPDDLDFGHPKFEMAKQRVVEHFHKNDDSKIIIFCEYRESVLLMYRALLQSRPLVKPKVFVGQGGTGSIRAVTQKQQMEVMEQFRSGTCNTLVATSVAEEGIDVGEVDLIICFDINTRNPTRFIQRIGRTGRRRQGNIIMMATEGKEQAIMKEVLHSKDKLNQKIVKNLEVSRALYKSAPRIVPPEFDPKCMEIYMSIKETKVENKKSSSDRKTKASKERKQKLPSDMPVSQKNDLRSYLRKVELDKEDREVFCTGTAETSAKSFSGLDVTGTNLNELDRIKRKIERLQKEPIIEVPTDMSKIMRSASLSNPIKRFALKMNVDYLKEKLQSQQALNAVCDKDVYVPSDDELNLKLELSVIEKVVGKGMIGQFIEEHQISDDAKSTREDFSFIFRDFEQRSFVDDVENFLDKRIKEIDDKLKLVTVHRSEGSDVLENAVDRDQNELSDVAEEGEEFYSQHESRYLSQLIEIDKNKINDQSTPLRSPSRKNKHTGDADQKQLFCFDEFDDDSDPFGLIEVTDIESKQKKDNNPKISACFENKTDEQNIFDDDFDDFFANSELKTEIDNIEKVHLREKTASPVKPEKDILVTNLKESRKVTSPLKQTNTSRQDIEDFDYTEFFEPFDCDDLATIEEAVRPHDMKIKSTDAVNTTSCSVVSNRCSTSVCDIPRMKSAELFSSNDQTSLLLNPNQDVETNHVHSPPNIANRRSFNTSPPNIANKRPTDTSPSIFTKGVNFKRLRLTGAVDKSISSTADNSIQSVGKLPTVNESPIVMQRRGKRVIDSDSDVEELPNSQTENISIYANRHIRSKKFKRRRCEFIDDEAKVSDDENDDENHMENSEFSQMQLDSVIVVDDDVDDHPEVDMRAKYLQSVRSPGKKGAFKIPEPRVYNDKSYIFSQFVPFEGNSVYKEDSFVISSDEEIVEEPMTQCPLERAEAILKARRRERQNKKNDRRYGRKLRLLENSSEEDDVD